MQCVAAVLGDNYQGFVGIDVAPYLEPAKGAIASSYLGEIEHPHYPESYYVLASNIKYAK